VSSIVGVFTFTTERSTVLVSAFAPSASAVIRVVSAIPGEFVAREIDAVSDGDGAFSKAVMRVESAGAEAPCRGDVPGRIGNNTFHKSSTPIASAMARKARRSCFGSSANLDS